jgi:hypothetical protein
MSAAPSPSSPNAWALALMARLRAGNPLPTDGYWTDPGAIFRASGQTPDPWQLEVLTGGWSNCRLCCSRQVGKSRVMAALAIKTMLVEAPARVVVVAPSEDQSKELIQEHVMQLMEGIGWPVPPSKTPNELSFELQNGSSIEGLPGNARTNRGISNVRLLILDEAALIPDDLYFAMLPVITVSQGRVIAGSTPVGKRGWFFKEFSEPQDRDWLKIRVRGDMCARHTPEFLAKLREKMGDRWFRQEMEASFEDMIDAAFSGDDIDAAMGGDFDVLF